MAQSGVIVGIADASDAAEAAEVSSGFESVFLTAPYVEAIHLNRLEVGGFYAMAVGSHLEGRSTSRNQRP